MSQTTTEAKLLEEIETFSQDCDDARSKIKHCQNELDRLLSTLLECQINLSNKEEELRRFRLMYTALDDRKIEENKRAEEIQKFRDRFPELCKQHK